MRKFIEAVSGLLVEGRKENEQMVNPLIKGLIDPKNLNKVTSDWKEIVKQTRSLLIKEDRVVWYLRNALMNYLYRNESMFTAEIEAALVKNYVAKTGKPYVAPNTARTRNLIGTLEHFLSMPVPEIQNYQFDKQSIDDVIDDFDRFETDWQKSLESAFQDDYDDANNEIIIDFGNGWCWINTNRAYCSKESKAMGHCGNGPRSHTDDQLLSLRKKINVGNQTYWEPHLTFILNDDAQLTEMKGKGNEKPSRKYHDMIIALLLDPIVGSIRGGGYLPENNFSLDDLDDNVREEILNKKYELAGIDYLFKKEGLSDRVLEGIDDIVGGHGIPYYEDIDDKTTVLQIWRTVTHFMDDELRYEMNGTYEMISEAITSNYVNDLEWLEDPYEWVELMFKYFEEKPTEMKTKFMDAVKVKLNATTSATVPELIEILNQRDIDFEEVRSKLIPTITKFANFSSRRVINDISYAGYDFHLYINKQGEVIFECSTPDFIKTILLINGYLGNDGGDYEHYNFDANLLGLVDKWFALDSDTMYEMNNEFSNNKSYYNTGRYNPYGFRDGVEKLAMKAILSTLE